MNILWITLHVFRMTHDTKCKFTNWSVCQTIVKVCSTVRYCVQWNAVFLLSYFYTSCPSQTLTEPWSKCAAHYSCIPVRVRLTPWIIHPAVSTCFGKKQKEKVLAAALPLPLFCFIINHTIFSLSGSDLQRHIGSIVKLTKLKQLRYNPTETVSQTGTCALVRLLLCQQPNWKQLAQRLFYMAEHDRLQLFYCSCFVNGTIWMKLWLELPFMTRHSGVSACQKDTSWKLPENRRWRSLSSNEQACSFSACISWSAGVGCLGRGRWWQQQASHFYQRLYWENKRLSSKNSTTMRVYNMISYGDNKSWWILIMTPLALLPCTHHHLSLPRSFVNTPRPARPAGCQMELTRSQPALSLLSPVALEGKPSSEAKATSPQQIPLLCHSAGTRVFVSQCVHLALVFVLTQCLTSLLKVRSDSFRVIYTYNIYI